MHGVCIFEDSAYTNLLPLVYTRPVYRLRCGIMNPEEKILLGYPEASVSLFCREYLSDISRERAGGEFIQLGSEPFGINTLDEKAESYLFINGRVLNWEPVPLEGPEEVGLAGGTTVYVRLSTKQYSTLSPKDFLEGKVLSKLSGVAEKEVRPTLINYYWDIIKHNKEEIKKDWERLRGQRGIGGKIYEMVALLNPANIFVGEGSKLKPCCVLDAENGPIYIAEEVLIEPNSTIIGPAYIGKGSVLRPSTRLREGSNIGEQCRTGGEISNSILHSYSNKQHDGFLGDSYVGSWVNLGAGTTNSNLKNTYGTIRVQFGDKTVDSGEIFLGVAVGDHTRVGIDSGFTAGSIAGFCANVIGRGPIPKFIPSFSWCAEKIQTYNLENAIEVTRRTMARRGKTLSEAEETLFQKIHELTQEARGTAPYI